MDRLAVAPGVDRSASLLYHAYVVAMCNALVVLRYPLLLVPEIERFGALAWAEGMCRSVAARSSDTATPKNRLRQSMIDDHLELSIDSGEAT